MRVALRTTDVIELSGVRWDPRVPTGRGFTPGGVFVGRNDAKKCSIGIGEKIHLSTFIHVVTPNFDRDE